MEDYLNWIYGILSSVVAAVVGYFSGRRKNEAETDSVVVSNYDKLIQQYTTFKETLLEEVGRLNKLVLEQNLIIDEQRKLLREAAEQIERLTKELKKLNDN
jgi:peptidoglycan hydrolase CwlO-like protein